MIQLNQIQKDLIGILMDGPYNLFGVWGSIFAGMDWKPVRNGKMFGLKQIKIKLILM